MRIPWKMERMAIPFQETDANLPSKQKPATMAKPAAWWVMWWICPGPDTGANDTEEGEGEGGEGVPAKE